MDERFLAAVEKVLNLEGGYVHDPADPGGETRFGISKRSYPDVDIKELTRDEAIEIYRRDWWKKYGYGQIKDDRIADKIFDLAVNMGPRRAHVLLQTAEVQTGGKWIDVDGALGPLTIDAVNSHPQQDLLLAALKERAIMYYVSLNKPRFLAGWIRRALA